MLIIRQGAKGDMLSRGILGRGKLIRERKLISIHGIKRFCGPPSVEFTDGTVFSSCLKTSTSLEAKMTRDDGGQPRLLKDYSTPAIPR